MTPNEKSVEQLIQKVKSANSPFCEQCFPYAEKLLLSEREKVKVTGETSDGYHTFNELYEHRVLLWINLCLLGCPDACYLVENHYDGWFLLGMETTHGQISYHCPNKYLDLVKAIPRRHPKFDGHTSADVIERLKAMASPATEEGKA